MHIGLLGTGHVAQLLAAAWGNAGHTIVLGSRDPTSKHLAFAVQPLGATVTAADIVVNAIRGSATLATITSIDTAAFAGKTVIDVANAFSPTYALLYPNASLAEALQEALPHAHIVKTMNTAAMTVMTNPRSVGPSSVFLSGDNAAAKAQTVRLLHDLGWTDDAIVDLGGIQSARGPEHFFLLSRALADALTSPAFNVRVVR